MAAAVALSPPALPERIEAFDADLTEFEIAVVKALIKNDEAISEALLHVEALLAHAFVMPDGRRVFKTEDGSQVFDEFGEEVSPEELDPSLIDDNAPSWETFSAANSDLQRLHAERSELLEYQKRLDAARDEISDGEISAAELDALDAELADSMPPAVAEHVVGFATIEPEIGSEPDGYATRSPSQSALNSTDLDALTPG